jgi:osmotically-inducible protein OsmY
MEMSGTFSSGAASAGLRASVIMAIAYDEVCMDCQIEVMVTAEAIVLLGVVKPAAALRALKIAREIAGRAPVWDRMIWE